MPVGGFMRTLVIIKTMIKSAKTCLALPLLLLLSSTANAEDGFVWAPAQPLGSTLPAFEVVDNAGNPTQISQLIGKNGTLLFFSRSTDW